MRGEIPGFPQRLENLENESGHGNVMEHALFADIKQSSVGL